MRVLLILALLLTIFLTVDARSNRGLSLENRDSMSLADNLVILDVSSLIQNLGAERADSIEHTADPGHSVAGGSSLSLWHSLVIALLMFGAVLVFAKLKRPSKDRSSFF